VVKKAAAAKSGTSPGIGAGLMAWHEKEGTAMNVELRPVGADLPVAELVARARHGDQRAWDALVERYAPLVWSICRQYRLGEDAGDVAQTVWLALVSQLGAIRDPAALAGWLSTTTRRECLRAARAARRLPPAGQVLDVADLPDERARMAEDDLLAAERHDALRQAFADLPTASRELVTLLLEDPPLPYAQISARLGIPVGSIGPSRARCLEKLRRHPAIAGLMNAEACRAS
jgi:RNA polymerase sigma factor (sigma-70 family)